MKFPMLLLAATLVIGNASKSFAQATAQDTTDNGVHQYFSINEQPIEENLRKRAEVELNPTTFADLSPIPAVNVLKKIIINMLSWNLHAEDRPLPSENYMRKLHFGRWINDPTDDTCMNTRAKVLVRESSAPVTYRGTKTCVVENGRWYDNYTDAEIGSSRQIQIDHLVPLKNAYLAGAWTWDYKTRCLYANYMGLRDHLIAAEAHENMSKGDRGPEGYLPPNESYRCEYMRNWLTVKTIWGLSLTSAEAQAIHDNIQAYHCDPSTFRLKQSELRGQRDFIQNNLEFCIQNKR
jgi:hypothetical protein